MGTVAVVAEGFGMVGDAGSVSQWVMSSSSWMGQATPTCAGRRTALAGPASSLLFHMLLGCAADTGTAVQSAPRWRQPSLRTPPQHGDHAVRRSQLRRLLLGGTFIGRDRNGRHVRSGDQVAIPPAGRLRPMPTSTADALLDSMGSLSGVHDARRRLPFPYPAFRLPPPPTQPGGGQVIAVSGAVVASQGPVCANDGGLCT